MLNDPEWRVLAMIEEGLRADDPRFVDAVRTGRAGPARRQHRWLVRALVGFGILLVLVGLLAAAGGLFLEGLLFGAAGVAWSRFGTRRAAAVPPGGGPDHPIPGPVPTQRPWWSPPD